MKHLLLITAKAFATGFATLIGLWLAWISMVLIWSAL